MNRYKKIPFPIFWGIALTLVVTALACEKSLDTWSANECVYFDVREKTSKNTWSSELFDTTRYTFNFVPDSVKETVMRVRVSVQGKCSDVARTVAYEVSESSTAVHGTDYRIVNEELVVGADSTCAYIEIVLKRTESLRLGEKKITLCLLENEHFRLSYPYEQYKGRDSLTSLITHQVMFGEVMTDWPGSESLKKVMTSNWGRFSWAKLDFMCEVMQFEAAVLIDQDYMTLGRIAYVKNRVQKELDIRAAAGNPVMDGDKPMKMGDGK